MASHEAWFGDPRALGRGRKGEMETIDLRVTEGGKGNYRVGLSMVFALQVHLKDVWVLLSIIEDLP